MASQNGPRIINLDDNGGRGKNKEYSPPKSLTVHLSKIDMPELRPRGTPLPKQQATRHDQDSGKKKEKDQPKRGKAKDKDRDKDKDKDKDGRLKRTSPPPRRSSSPPHPSPPAVVVRKHRSQFFQPTSSALSPSVPGPSSGHAPPLPPRTPHHSHSAGRLHRTSMYGSLNAVQDRYYYDYEVRREEATSPGNSASTSGLLGRFLGR